MCMSLCLTCRTSELICFKARPLTWVISSHFNMLLSCWQILQVDEFNYHNLCKQEGHWISVNIICFKEHWYAFCNINNNNNVNMNNAAVDVRFWTARCVNTSKCLCILSRAFSDTKRYLFSLHVLFSLNLFVPFGQSFAASKSSLRRGSAIHEQNRWFFYRGISVDWGIWLELTWWILIRCFRFNPAEVRLLNSHRRFIWATGSKY